MALSVGGYSEGYTFLIYDLTYITLYRLSNNQINGYCT